MSARSVVLDGLQQHVLSPTHQTGGTLDLVITFNDFGVDELSVEPPGIVSDHSLIICSLPVHRLTSATFFRQVRSWRGVDRATLRQHIADSSLGHAPSSTSNVDELFQTYDDTLRNIADQLAPERSVNCRLRARPLCPWFDAECSAIRRNCRRLERRYRRTRDVYFFYTKRCKCQRWD